MFSQLSKITSTSSNRTICTTTTYILFSQYNFSVIVSLNVLLINLNLLSICFVSLIVGCRIYSIELYMRLRVYVYMCENVCVFSPLAVSVTYEHEQLSCCCQFLPISGKQKSSQQAFLYVCYSLSFIYMSAWVCVFAYSWYFYGILIPPSVCMCMCVQKLSSFILHLMVLGF